MAKRQDAVFP